MAWDASSETYEGPDWALLIVSTAFALIVLGTIGETAWFSAHAPRPTDLHQRYDAALAAAAVKRPAYATKLETIAPAASTVEVVTFRSRPPKMDGLTAELFVALPAQLHTACVGAADPVRRLQEILGLPPKEAEDLKVYRLSVERRFLSRPCIGEHDLGAAECGIEPPARLQPNADAGTVRAEYDRMYFLATQMWKSYRSGFSEPGYPFTGMGWTYDWHSGAAHIGVTEFVVAPGASLKPASGTPELTAAEFCRAA